MRWIAGWTLLSLMIAGCAAPEPEPEPEAPAEAAAATEPDVRGEEVTYEVDGVTLDGYLAYDAAQPGTRPGVLVVHEWWGHNEYARERARMLAEMGYTAFALDMYGDGKRADHPEDAQKFMMEIVGDMETGVARFEAARELLEAHETTDPERTAAIGYCFGGGVVLHMARIGADLDGVASFHGGLATETPARAGVVQAKILVLHGEADPFVTADQLEAFKTEMADAGVDLEFVGYPGVQHSFTNPGATAVGERFGLPLVYDEAADADSWARLEAFLAEIFGG